mmetsp:Transcript_26063/g.29789  ORF Transcript_26063/g.29789 Transcript_26063/m.29789 type:complete len:525 (+) Transcript_26063:29-1603(+)
MKFQLAIAVVTAAASNSNCVSAFTFTSNQPTSFTRTRTLKPLYGILDEINSDSYNLLGNVEDNVENSSEIETAYETFLAQLVFSANDPRMDIVENIDLATDPKWLDWLDKKIKKSNDVEEKMALRDLNEMILDIKKRIEISKEQEARKAKEAEEAEKQRFVEADAEADEGRNMSDADVLRKASVVDRSGLGSASDMETQKKVSFFDQELTPEIRMSYDDMCKKVLPPYKAGDTTASVVFSYYDQFDAQFIKVLNERTKNGEKESQDVLDALAVEQNKRLSAATESLKTVLGAGDPKRMEGSIVKMAREGKIDEPFLLLLEANANQAEEAGAMGPAQLMRKLGQRAMEEKDKQSSTKEIKLLRRLLRTDDETERQAFLEDAFTPKVALLVEGTAANAAKAMEGEAPEEEKPLPEVPPPDFINACKAVLLNFGNLSSDDDRGDLTSRIKQIAAEAEVVATRIYGKSMSNREQQDRMWKESTTSIFDLETLEIDAERRGDTAPWAEGASDDILPGFDTSGKMKIGGS